MTSLTKELLQELISKALIDKAFRDALIAAITEKGKEIAIELSESDIQDLRQLIPDIERFGDLQGLGSEDAKNWTVGVCEIKDLFSHKRPPKP